MPKKIKKIVIKDEDIKREERPKLLIATPMYGGMCTGHYMAEAFLQPLRRCALWGSRFILLR
jgi:hypothetical protein